MNLKQWQRSKKIKAEAEAAAKRTVERVLNAVKEPVMSEFKVGDKVVYVSSEVDFLDDSEIHEVSLVTENGLYKVQGLYFSGKALRHATPEEIAAGHRIDRPEGGFWMGWDPGRDITHDLGDDSHIENHISPLCKSKDV